MIYKNNKIINEPVLSLLKENSDKIAKTDIKELVMNIQLREKVESNPSDLSEIKKLLDNGANVNILDSEWDPLIFTAISNFNVELVKLLIQSKYHPNFDAKPPIGNDMLGFAEIIYKHKPSISSQKIKNLLIEKKAELDKQKDFSGIKSNSGLVNSLKAFPKSQSALPDVKDIKNTRSIELEQDTEITKKPGSKPGQAR